MEGLRYLIQNIINEVEYAPCVELFGGKYMYNHVLQAYVDLYTFVNRWVSLCTVKRVSHIYTRTISPN